MTIPPVVRSSRKAGEAELAEQTEQHLDAEQAPAAPPAAANGRAYSATTFGSGRRRRGGPAASARPVRREADASLTTNPGAGDELGIPAFPEPLPGFHHYPASGGPVRPHRELDVGPAVPYYSRGNAHGVAQDEVHHGGRITARPEDRAEHGQAAELVDEEIHPRFEPIPVVVVESGGGQRPLTRAALQQKTVPAAGADPIVLVQRDPNRRSVRLLNESAAAVYTELTPANPGAGSPFVYTNNTGQAQTLVSATYLLTTSATVATRFAQLILKDAASNIVTALQVGTGTAASSSVEPMWQDGVTTIANAAAGFAQGATIGFPIQPGWTITLTAGSLQAGDQISAIVLVFSQSGPVVRITGDLTLTGGAELMPGATGYLEIYEQDEICAYCPLGGPALVSVITQYDVAGGG